MPHPSDRFDSEAALIGYILAHEDGLEAVPFTDFELEAHRAIYQAVIEDKRRFGSFDLERMVAGLPLDEKEAALDAIMYACPDSAIQLHINRLKVFGIKDAVANAALSNAADWRERVYQELEKASDSGLSKEPRTFAEIAASAAEERNLLKTLKDPSAVGVCLSGLRDLDEMTGGIRPGRVMVCAARSSMGKSLWGGAYAINEAKSGKRVLIVSLEMDGEELFNRAIGSATSTPYSDLERGRDQIDDVVYDMVSENLADLPIFVEDGGIATPASLSAALARFSRKCAQDDVNPFVVVDHGGLVDGDGKTEYERATSVARTVKSVAQSLRLPLLVLLQLSRAPEGRINKRPMLSDLRESGHWEQNAHTVIGLYRDAYYAEREPDCEDVAEQMQLDRRRSDRTLEQIVLKARSGKTGVARAYIDVKTGEIKDLEERYS